MIEKLKLQDFKNFRQATLSLGGFSLLVGTNASGKSNLRDALRFLHGIGRGYSLAEILGDKWSAGGAYQWKGIRGGRREVAFLGEREFALAIRFGVFRRPSLALHQYAIKGHVGQGSTPPKILHEEYRFGETTVFLRRGEQTQFAGFDSPNDEISLPPDLESLSVLSMISNPTEEFRRTLSDESVKIVERLSAHSAPVATNATETLSSMRFLDLDPPAMRQPSQPGQSVLGDRGENLSSVLHAICSDAAKKEALTGWLRQLTPMDVTNIEFAEDLTGAVLALLVESDGRKISAYSASDGTLRFLGLLAALLGPRPAGLYFIEEIDTGIHPTRLHLLIQLIEQAVQDQKIQVVATTHAPQVLGLLNEKSREAASLVYRLEGEREGRIKRIMDLPHVADVLQNENLGRLHETGWLEDAVEFEAGERAEP